MPHTRRGVNSTFGRSDAGDGSDVDRVGARALLDRQRAEVVARLAALEADREAMVAQVVQDPPDDEHDPEGATVGFEHARTRALRDDALARLAELDAALARVDDGTFGTCLRCGTEIPDARLRARPTARTCVPCA